MVQCGIDRIGEFDHLFRGKRLGLITSGSGVDRNLTSSIEILAEKYRLEALFSPEHGVRGNVDAGADVGSFRDPYTGVMVYSLYSAESKHISTKLLSSLDALVYDIQDLGVRYYTFISTMFYAMQTCAVVGRPLVILDRPNPLGGRVEGNVVQPGYESFVGAYSLCMRYGLTVGELANMMKKECGFPCAVEVVPMSGWNHKMLYPDTGRVWVMPSPNMPSFESVLTYTGTCLFEGTNVSEGRGTAAPFSIIGAPYVDGYRLAKEMNRKKLPGAAFTPAYFTPSASKHQGVPCEGVHIHVTDPERYQAADVGIELLFTLRDWYPKDFRFLPETPEWGKPFASVLFGGPEILNPNATAEKIRESFRCDSETFAKRKEKFHLYP